MALGDQIIEQIKRKKAGLHLLAEAIGGGLESQAKQTASWTDRTGNTRRNIHGGADKTRKGSTIYLAHGTKVGGYLEEGTGKYGPTGRPYVIVPKNKKALRFNVGGSTVFASKVIHPGMKAQPVVGPTVDSEFPRIKKQVKRYWENT